MKTERKEWIVTVKCTVIKEVVTRECTREEAAENPWSGCLQERELSQPDWEIQSIEPNE